MDTTHPTTRIGAIGDVHAEDALLDVALRVLREEGAEAIVCVGDVVDGAGDVDRCVRLLANAGAVVVRGNHDRWLFEGALRASPGATQLDRVVPATAGAMRAWPTTARVPTTRGDLLVCHGVGDDDMVRLGADTDGYALQCIDELADLLADAALRFVVAGHTHRRMARRFDRPRGAKLWFVNAGTLKRTEAPGFVVVDVGRGAEFFDVTPSGVVGRAAFVAF